MIAPRRVVVVVVIDVPTASTSSSSPFAAAVRPPPLDDAVVVTVIVPVVVVVGFTSILSNASAGARHTGQRFVRCRNSPAQDAQLTRKHKTQNNRFNKPNT